MHNILATLADFVQALLRNDMPTRHHHRRIAVRSLFFAHGAYEDGVKEIRRWQWYLDLKELVPVAFLVLRATLTGSSLALVHCPPTSPMTLSSFSRTGRAIPPAVTAVYSGLFSLKPSRPQNSLVKLLDTSFQASLLKKTLLYGECCTAGANASAPNNDDVSRR